MGTRREEWQGSRSSRRWELGPRLGKSGNAEKLDAFPILACDRVVGKMPEEMRRAKQLHEALSSVRALDNPIVNKTSSWARARQRSENFNTLLLRVARLRGTDPCATATPCSFAPVRPQELDGIGR